jgi:hypothetical protein
MSCLTCNKLLHHHMCNLCNISRPFPSPWHMLLTHMYLWTNHLCISYKTQLVHLSCYSITKTKQGPFTYPLRSFSVFLILPDATLSRSGHRRSATGARDRGSTTTSDGGCGRWPACYRERSSAGIVRANGQANQALLSGAEPSGGDVEPTLIFSFCC